MISPVFLLVAAGAAVMAFGRKKKGGELPPPPVGSACESLGPIYVNNVFAGSWVSDGQGGCIAECAAGYQVSEDGTTCVPVGDHIVDEGEITSEGGEEYAYRIWFIDGQVGGPYVGELLIDDVWTSGPVGPDAQIVATELEVLADSMDGQEPKFDTGLVACTLGPPIEGPFDWHFYDELEEQWDPIGDLLDPSQVYEPGRGFCVMEDPEQPGTFVAQVYGAQNEVLVEFAHPDPSVAASMAYYGIFNPSGPFPWVKFQLAPATS